MLYREIIAVCSEIHTKHINILFRQNVALLNVKLAVHIVTAPSHNLFEMTVKIIQVWHVTPCVEVTWTVWI